MLRTLEAAIDEQGSVHLLETIALDAKKYRALVTILDDEPQEQVLRPWGLCAGEFVVPSAFNDPLPERILQELEASCEFF